MVADDRIVAINGKSPADLDFAGIWAELGRQDLELTVERGGQTFALRSSN